MIAIELIEKLKKVPADTPVIMSSDEEGNQFAALDAAVDDAVALNGKRRKAIILWPHHTTIDIDD